jgi:hypothetical protein
MTFTWITDLLYTERILLVSNKLIDLVRWYCMRV